MWQEPFGLVWRNLVYVCFKYPCLVSTNRHKRFHNQAICRSRDKCRISWSCSLLCTYLHFLVANWLSQQGTLATTSSDLSVSMSFLPNKCCTLLSAVLPPGRRERLQRVDFIKRIRFIYSDIFYIKCFIFIIYFHDCFSFAFWPFSVALPVRWHLVPVSIKLWAQIQICVSIADFRTFDRGHSLRKGIGLLICIYFRLAGVPAMLSSSSLWLLNGHWISSNSSRVSCSLPGIHPFRMNLYAHRFWLLGITSHFSLVRAFQVGSRVSSLLFPLIACILADSCQWGIHCLLLPVPLLLG